MLKPGSGNKHSFKLSQISGKTHSTREQLSCTLCPGTSVQGGLPAPGQCPHVLGGTGVPGHPSTFTPAPSYQEIPAVSSPP